MSVKPKAWVVAVNMGYGHQRSAYPLRHLAPSGEVIFANGYKDIPAHDRKIWETSRKFYEFISRFRRTPLVGSLIFNAFDHFQKILKFYPRRDLSAPTLTLKQIFKFIQKGWGEHLIEKLSQESLPLITTFFTPAFMAEAFKYPRKIYCVVTDADVSRAWAPMRPHHSRIIYLAPTLRVVERLMQYGVPKENINLTGFPLPKENIGSANFEIARVDLARRLINLDPSKKYRDGHSSLIKQYVGELPSASSRPLTILFSIGGAGAQKEIALKIARSLKQKIEAGEVRLIISVGIRENLKSYFLRNAPNSTVLCDTSVDGYFQKFNEALRETDILWTKPSELSFYAGLGIPIIIAPPLGSQEHFNEDWLLKTGVGLRQENPAYVHEWLFDWLDAGWFAEAAMEGFIEIEKRGTFNIEELVQQFKQ